MRFAKVFTSLSGLALSLASLRIANCLPQATTDSSELSFGASPWLSSYELNVTGINYGWTLTPPKCTQLPFPATPNYECITSGITAFENWFANVTGWAALFENKFNSSTILTQNIRGEATNVLVYWYASKSLGLTAPPAPLTPLTLASNVIHYLQASQYAVACVELVAYQKSILLVYEESVTFVNPFAPPPSAPVTLPPSIADPTDPFAEIFMTCKQ